MREERRRFRREVISVGVVIRYNDWSLTGIKSLDISVSGIRLTLEEEIPQGKVVNLEINVPSPPVVARGRVVWTRREETKEGKFFQAGIEFIEIKQTDKVRIETYTKEGFWVVLP